MKKSRQEEIEELQKKVFGKDAPKRNIPSSVQEMMQEANRLEKKSSLDFEQLEQVNTSFQHILESQLKEIEEMNASVSKDMGMDEIEMYEKEITKDFNNKNEKIETLEEALKEKIMGQEKAIEDVVKAIRRPYVYKDESRCCLNSILIYGDRGSGKHQLIKEISNHLNMHIVSIDLSKYKTQEDEKTFLQDIYAATCKKNAILLFENPETCFKGYLTMVTQLFKTGSIELKKRYIQNQGVLSETNSSFVASAIGSIETSHHYLVLLTDLKKNKIIDLLGIDFMNALSDCIETDTIDAHLDAWIHQQIQELEKKANGILTTNLDESLSKYYQSMYIPSQGLYSLENSTKSILEALSQYKLEHKDIKQIRLYFDDTIMLECDGNTQCLFTKNQEDSMYDIDEIKKELNDIVGLEDVKKYVLSLEDNIKIQRLREQQGLKNATVSKHMIFTGNPGTGKTTIARLISRYFRAIGILSGGQLVEVTRADLVGRYVGHTAPLTMQVIESALGGVLFIDEAYSLYRGKEDSFGLECIDTIVKAIEDHRENLVVILAGYKKEMDAFLESNSGLKSRFPNIVDFKDYTADELVQISFIIAQSKDYFINDECKDALYAYYDKVQKDNSKLSGNGRMARNKVEEAILNQSSRILKDTSSNIQELKLMDFNLEEDSFVK